MNFVCLGCRTERLCGQTRADEGGEDALLDTGIVEGSMTEMICAVVVVCQRQAWN